MRGPNQGRAASGSRAASWSRDAGGELAYSGPYVAGDTDRTWTAVALVAAASTVSRASACCIARS